MAGEPKDFTLQLNGPHSVHRVEKYLGELAAAPVERPVVLQLPSRLKGDDLGGAAAVLQLIVTWAQRAVSGELRTYVTPSDALEDARVAGESRRQKDVDTLLKSEHGLVAALMARRIVDRDRKSIASLLMDPVQARLVKAGDTKAARRGSKVTLVAADHRGYSAPPALYQPASADHVVREVRSRHGFIELARAQLDVMQLGSVADRPTDDQVQWLGDFLYELFKNTHDWARSDVTGRVLDRSVRLLQSEYTGAALKVHQEHATGDEMLSKFLAHDVHAGPDRESARVPNMRRFIEITILDSGPGLAARVLKSRTDSRAGESASLAEEYDAFMVCLRKHMSTSGRPGRGSGLHHVQELLTQLHGYMRIRSGRLALARDYVRDPYEAAHGSQEPWLQDWTSQTEEPTEMAPVAGTLVTVIIPVRIATRDNEPGNKGQV